jgi:hypothetical protein
VHGLPALSDAERDVILGQAVGRGAGVGGEAGGGEAGGGGGEAGEGVDQ